jgi:hypothetical protein
VTELRQLLDAHTPAKARTGLPRDRSFSSSSQKAEQGSRAWQTRFQGKGFWLHCGS